MFLPTTKKGGLGPDKKAAPQSGEIEVKENEMVQNCETLYDNQQSYI